MGRDHEEGEAQKSPRGGAWEVRWVGAQRGQAPCQPRKWAQGRSGQKPQEKSGRATQCTASASRSAQEIIELVIASVRARFGVAAIGLGAQGIHFAGTTGAGVSHARTA
jgi:hypothetical protein